MRNIKLVINNELNKEKEKFFRGFHDKNKQVKKKESGLSKNRNSFRVKRKKQTSSGNIEETSGLLPFENMTMTSRLPNLLLSNKPYHVQSSEDISDSSEVTSSPEPDSVLPGIYKSKLDSISNVEEQAHDNFNDLFSHFIQLSKK